MKRRRHQRGFGLLEVLVLIGIIALGVVLGYPAHKRSGLNDRAVQLRSELGEIEQGVARASASLNAPPGSLLTMEQIMPHLHTSSPSLRKGLDPFGNHYGPQRNDRKPSMPSASAEHLKGMVPDDFWTGNAADGGP